MPDYSQSYSLPPPVGGWNARDRIEAMPEQDALRLDNWFPDTDKVSFRNGCSLHCNGMNTSPVQTMAAWVGAGGSQKIVASGGSQLYYVGASGPVGTSGDFVGGLTSAEWQTVNMRNYLVMFNGQDIPYTFNGSSFVGASYVAVGLSRADLFTGTNYRSRMYALEKDTASVWYTAADAIKGAVTQFDVQSLLKKGGPLVGAATWSTDAGNGMNDYLTLVSQQGEVLVYGGPYPGDSTWSMVYRGEIPQPVGKRSVGNIGTDVAILTDQGMIPLSDVFLKGYRAGKFETLNPKLDPALAGAAKLYRSSFGWQWFIYPLGKMLIINVPISEGAVSHQYVMNTFTGAACRFTGLNASSWCLYNGQPYYGGVDGNIYRFWTGRTDNGNFIDTNLEYAFNYFGGPNQNKAFTFVRPVLSASDGIELHLDMQVDLERRASAETVTIAGSAGLAWPWAWGSPWGGNIASNREWKGVDGMGRNGSVRMRCSFKDIECHLAATDVMFVPGGKL